MHLKNCLFLLIALASYLSIPLHASELSHTILPYNKKLKQKILNGEIFSESKVKSSKVSTSQGQSEQQELNFSIAGLHEKSCDYVLKKLSLYEDYSKFIDFVKRSEYSDKTGEINFLLSHTLLPYDMGLIFKLPRITKPGIYPFIFERGILTNLKGNIYVINHNKRCLFYSTANWSGPDTGFPNLVFEFFSQTLAKMTMERLFRISSTLSH